MARQITVPGAAHRRRYAGGPADGTRSGADMLTVMTFNIRYPEPSDGPHIWENRRDAVVSLLHSALPDVAGLQEPVLEQMEDIASCAPEYRWVGLSRYGNRFEKYTPLLYRKDAVTPIQWGSFWLSETPEVVASAYDGMEKPRVVTWGLFRDNKARTFAVFNAHLQYRPAEHSAKLRSAALIRDRIACVSVPAVLTGDFNHPAGEEVYRTLTPMLSDAWLQARDRSGPEGTFHGFTGQPKSPGRIDWI